MDRRQLKEAGYEVIIQAWHFRPGSDFVLEMQQAAINSDRTLIVLSQNYLDAEYTQPEWSSAFARDPTGRERILVPVRIAECQPEGMLQTRVHIDLVGKEPEVAKQALLDGIKPDGTPLTPPSFPGGAPTPQPTFPGVSPAPIWNVPHQRNPNFTGRDELLVSLREALESGTPAALTQAITGLGGVGKTQLALEYAYRHAGDYEIVWWVRSEEAAQLASDYAGLAERLNLPEKEAQDQSVTVEAVREALRQRGGWLLVFDNAQAREALGGYIPQGDAGNVIVTSRNAVWGDVAKPLEVQVLEREDSVAFLLNRAGQSDSEAADALAAELGDLPLALEQAGAYIDETRSTLAGYLTLFREQRSDMMTRNAPSRYYNFDVATTWTMSMQNVRKEEPVAADLLNLCAFLAPDDIPLDVIRAGAEHLPDDLKAVAANTVEWNKVIAALRRYSLSTVEGDNLSLHRLVQAVTRDGLSEEETRRWAGAAVEIVNAALPEEARDVRTWPTYDRLVPHALIAAGHADRLQVSLGPAQRLLDRVASNLGGRARYRESKDLFERALAMAEAAFGHNGTEVAGTANNLGFVLRDMGDLAGAKVHFERALAIGETATRVANLGGVLRDMGDLPGAKTLRERALAIGEEELGPDHPAVAVHVNNLGAVLQAMGDKEGAKEYFERALAIDEQALGPEHPTVAIRLNNLGFVLDEMGELEVAKAQFERALVINEAAYGPDHPAVATGVSNLGRVLLEMGDLQGAKAHCERALVIDEAAYGPDHPEVATDVNNLGNVLQEMGDLPEAQAYHERALAISERALGPDHPNTGMFVGNLGGVLRAMGDLPGAKAHFERALGIFEEKLGEEHPSTVAVRGRLERVVGEMEKEGGNS